MHKISLATIGVCVFYASASVGAFFNLKEFFMKIKTELLKDFIYDYVMCRIDDFEIDANEIVTTKAICVLAEIQRVIQSNDIEDFEKVEEIVCIFEKHKIDAGACHDFG